MAELPEALSDVITDFSYLPGLGPKSAARIAFHLLSLPRGDVEQIASHIALLPERVVRCERCNNYSEDLLCNICKSDDRDAAKILVVENPLDLIAFESTEFRGLYHVLGGLLSPLQGIGPDDIDISGLMSRLRNSTTKLELILACPTSLEGEATANYIENSILGDPTFSTVVVSRLARGLPSNSSIEHQDALTLNNSLRDRH